MCNNDNPGREKQKMRKMLRFNRIQQIIQQIIQEKLMRSLVERRIEFKKERDKSKYTLS